MSDLHRAVMDEIAQFSAPRTPPFAALRARRARRNRSRAAGAAVLSAAAAAAVVLIPSAWSSDPDRLPSFADPTTPPVASESRRYTLKGAEWSKYGPDHTELNTCLSLPGTSDSMILYSNPPIYGVTVAGSAQMADFEACIEAGVGVYIEQTRTTPAVDFPGLPGHPGDVQFAEICLSSNGHECRSVSRHVDGSRDRALPLARAFATARPLAAQDVTCRSLSEAYTVRFRHPSVETEPIVIPFGCGPVEVGGAYYEVSDEAKDLVREAYENPPWAGVADLVTQCVGYDRGQPDPDYVGLTQEQAQTLAAARGLTVQVLGSHSNCNSEGPHTYREGRMTLVIDDEGIVLYADET